MQRALILGTNAGQADIIRYLKSKNWEVHACGHVAIGPGVGLAHYFHKIDTIDIELVTELAKHIQADIVYSVASDSAIRTATKVSESLGLPTLLSTEIIDLFHFKDRLRKYLNDNGINRVRYQKVTSFDELDDWDIFPCVVKPSDSQGQRGVQLIDTKEQLEDAIQLAVEHSSSATAVVEEYLSGIEISTNIIIQNSKFIINEFTERLVYGKQYFGLPLGHSIPVRKVNEEIIRQARLVAEDFVSKLSVTDAVLYIQMVVTDQGPKIIEVAPRLDGCHIWRLLEAAKGYDLREFAIQTLIREKIEWTHAESREIEYYTLKFHQLKSDKDFKEDDFKVSPDFIFNEFRYSDTEQVVPINGNLEVVGYYVERS